MQGVVVKQEDTRVQALIIKNKNEKTYFINILRVIACFAVIVIHVHINYYRDLGGLISSETRNNMDLNYAIMTFAVPMFLTITGYIFLGYKEECTYKSILKYLVNFALIWVILGSILNVGEYVYLAHSFDISFVKKAVFQVFAGDTWDHLWYIRMVFFIYLILPVLKPFFSKDDKDIYIFFILFILELFIIPIYNSFSPLKLYTHFTFENYIIYVVLGAVLYRYRLKNAFTYNVIYIILILLIIYLNAIKKSRILTIGSAFNFGTFLLVVLIFTMCRNLFNKENKVISFLSRYTLDIYIYHVVFLHVITKIFRYDFLVRKNAMISTYVFAILLFVGTLLFSMIVKPLEDRFLNLLFRKR